MANEQTLTRPGSAGSGRNVGGTLDLGLADAGKAGGDRWSVVVNLLGVLSVVAVLAALYGALIWAPREAQMGDIQRIFYFHVPSAWVAMGPAFTMVFACCIAYLVKKDLRYDRIAAASAEIGVMFTTITLITGPIWARPIWGAYWTWDPRLTTTLVLWFIYVAYLMLRSATPSGHRRARLSAVFGIVGYVDVPIVFMSIRWWRTIHPDVLTGQDSGLDPSMRAVLFFALGAFTLLYAYLLAVRVRQDGLAMRVERLRHLLQQR